MKKDVGKHKRTKRRIKRPRTPNNLNFWLFVLENEEETKQFMERGSDRAKRELKQAQRYKDYLEKEKENG